MYLKMVHLVVKLDASTSGLYDPHLYFRIHKLVQTIMDVLKELLKKTCVMWFICLLTRRNEILSVMKLKSYLDWGVVGGDKKKSRIKDEKKKITDDEDSNN